MLTRVQKISFIIIFSLIIGAFIFGTLVQVKRDKLLSDNVEIAFAEVVKYYSNMGADYIVYKFLVDGVYYSGGQGLCLSAERIFPIGANDLKIEYAVEDPSYNRIVDERYCPE